MEWATDHWVIGGWLVMAGLVILGWGVFVHQFIAFQHKSQKSQNESYLKAIQLKTADQTLVHLVAIEESLYKVTQLLSELRTEKSKKNDLRWVKPDRQIYDAWKMAQATIWNYKYFFVSREIILRPLNENHNRFMDLEKALLQKIDELTDHYFNRYNRDVPLGSLELKALAEMEDEAMNKLETFQSFLAGYVVQVQNQFFAEAFLPHFKA